MNNLLRTLTQNQVKSNSDLKLLLTTVKEARRQGHDSKLTDPFYDSLEGLLLDLRTVSIDNHDAEAFLKPVLKAEAPDYYDVIHTPMDFQTMLKKVKQKQYKSKREFKDDLDLIWSNCLTYNANPSHPLRKCAMRLKQKAERLLQNITDRKERTDPHIPLELASSSGVHTKLNGHINGIGHAVSYTPTSSKSTPPNKLVLPLKSTASLVKGFRKDIPFADMPALVRTGRGMALFRELDRGLEEAVQKDDATKTDLADRLRQLATTGYEFSIPALVVSSTEGREVSENDEVSPVLGEKRKLNGITDDLRPLKRPRIDSFSSSQTLAQQPSSQSQQSSSTAYGQSPYISTPSSVTSTTLATTSTAPTSPATISATPSLSVSTLIEQDTTPLWWSASHSDTLLANGLPEIPCRSSSPLPYQRKRRRNQTLGPIPLFLGTLSSSTTVLKLPPAPSIPTPTAKRKKRRKKEPSPVGNGETDGKGETKAVDGEEPLSKSLLSLMNNNLRTMKRIRMTHGKFAALGLGKDGNPVGGEEGDGAGVGVGESGAMMDVDDAGVVLGGVGIDESDKIDDRPWMVRMKETAVYFDDSEGVGKTDLPMVSTIPPAPAVDAARETRPVPTSAGISPATLPKPGKRRRAKPAHVVGGVEMGSENADACLKWMGERVLEHAGFQGTSRVALNVMAGVTSEYLQNVGRTIKFLSDKFGNTMSAEEIILHTLFESGNSKVQDLERYITDDVERYGSRLGDLEKKLVGAYREATAVDTVIDEDGIFAEDSEDEDSTLALGGFADSLGMDYFGLKELGIAEEFGMSSLSIPKRLLKGKKKQNVASASSKPTEPPLPYPLPRPLIPLTAAQIPKQIGLLQPYYNQRITALIPPTPMVSSQPQPPISAYPSIPMLAGPTLTPNFPQIYMQAPTSSTQSPAQPSTPQPLLAASPSNPSTPTTLPPQPPAVSTPTSSSQQLPTTAQTPQTTQPLPGPTLHPYPQAYPAYGVSYMALAMPTAQPQQPPPPPPPTLTLPDDSPLPAQAKMGPLGQILKTGASANPGAKKKAAKAANKVEVKNEPIHDQVVNNTTVADPGSAGVGTGSNSLTATTPLSNGIHPTPSPVPGDPGGTPKKKKGATGVGTGNGRKKKILGAAAAQSQAQMQVQVHQGQPQPQENQGPGGGQGPPPPPPTYTPVVTASA
ncbi:hypothetical protein E1B28_010440 [Marasmius oreades]|uniref:Bromo domain-containing protein n=1 Tax=Marasmius oreades TaxID=181124 RepID=A0A9P7RXS1_9AGAR|nr:uncharacterized protein E1B28_010440 [Marasmius oreades]KAG7091403.1 hypothetical protein E1B28_010440 [Marasmius oreades]